jgi:hypothetical protein
LLAPGIDEQHRIETAVHAKTGSNKKRPGGRFQVNKTGLGWWVPRLNETRESG